MMVRKEVRLYVFSTGKNRLIISQQYAFLGVNPVIIVKKNREVF